jgi:hypothetical protein
MIFWRYVTRESIGPWRCWEVTFAAEVERPIVSWPAATPARLRRRGRPGPGIDQGGERPAALFGKEVQMIIDDLDSVTSEIQQYFMQRGGWDQTRYLLGKLVAELNEESRILREAIDEIRFHGTDAPSAANYPEEEWWQKVAEDCMRIAAKASESYDPSKPITRR